MKPYILIGILFLIFAIVGCQTKEAEMTSKENSGRLEKIDRDLAANSAAISELKSEIAARVSSIQSELSTVKSIVEKSATKTTVASTAAGAGEGMIMALPEDQIDSISMTVSAIASSLEGITGELAALKADLNTLTRANREVAQREERQRIWEELNDPQKLGEKLDAFTQKQSEKLLETGRSGEFQSDMANLKTALTAQYSTDELALKYKNELKARIAETTDERMKGFLTRQLENLQSATGDQLTETVNNMRRFDTMRQIGEVARKYDISREDLQASGLISFGGFGGGGREGGRRGGQGGQGGTGGTAGTGGGRRGGGGGN